MRVSIAERQSLRLRGWDGQYVLFDERSGRTQLLTQPAGLVLCELMQGSRSVDDLAGAIAARLGMDVETVHEYVGEVVDTFVRQEIVAFSVDS